MKAELKSPTKLTSRQAEVLAFTRPDIHQRAPTLHGNLASKVLMPLKST
jgi:hypothetical protein